MSTEDDDLLAAEGVRQGANQRPEQDLQPTVDRPAAKYKQPVRKKESQKSQATCQKTPKNHQWTARVVTHKQSVSRTGRPETSRHQFVEKSQEIESNL